MPGQSSTDRVRPKVEPTKDNVVHIYQVRPEMALEHLRRTTGLEFDPMPENLVGQQPTGRSGRMAGEPPLLTDVVDF
jgi:hypothetical protein